MSTTTPLRVRLTASPYELHGPRRLRHGTPRFPRPYSRTVVGGPLRAHGPSFVGRPFRRSKAVTPSTTLHGPTLARVRASAHSRGREDEKRQCSDGGFCRQNLVSEKRRLHVISSDLQPPSGLLHPHPTCACPRPEASCRTHPPCPAVAAFQGRPGCVFRGLGGAQGLRRAACCPAPAFWAPCSLLPCACFLGFPPPPQPAPLGRFGEVKPLLPQPPSTGRPWLACAPAHTCEEEKMRNASAQTPWRFPISFRDPPGLF